MFTFFIGISILIIGSLTYGRFVNKLIKPNPNKPTPAYYSYDKSDYAPVGDFKSKMILALGIIGAGPVFGPIMAAIWGPIILLLIPIGNIIGGAIHDYFVGFASLKNNGKQLSWMGTKFLGIKLGKVVLFFIVFLLLLVSSVFVYMPLDVLPFMKNAKWWWVFIGIVIIFSYYFLSIILPINKFMAKIYPIIGIAFMTFAIVFLITLFINNGSELWSKGLSRGGDDLKYPLEIWHKNSWTFWGNKINADKSITFGDNFSKPIIPGLFVTITCGILSGFHATQTPMVARIIKTEEKSYSTFYGMMNIEAFVAMIWAFLTIWVMSDEKVFKEVIKAGNGKINPGTLIVEVNKHFFGPILQYIPIIILLLLPLTSGETGFRALRLTIADWLGLKQDTNKQKILLAIPIFLVGIAIVLFAKLETNGFNFLWQSFAFFNVGLGVVALLVVTIFTKHYAPKKKLYLIPLIPMVFWMFISFTVLFWRPIDIEDAFWWKEKETTGLIVSITLGILLTSIITGLLLYKLSYRSKDLIEAEYNPTIEELEKAKEIKKLYK